MMYSEAMDSEEEQRHSMGQKRFDEPEGWDSQDSQEYAHHSDEDVAQQASPKRRKIEDPIAVVKVAKKIKVPVGEGDATVIQRKPCKKCEHSDCAKNGMPSSDGQFFYCINHLREFGLQPRQRRNLCQHVGCNKWAQSSADGQYLFCTPHMRQHGLQPKFCCNHPGCQKWAQKNVDGRYLYCAAHMKEYGLQRCVTVKSADKDKSKGTDGNDGDGRGGSEAKTSSYRTNSKKQLMLNQISPLSINMSVSVSPKDYQGEPSVVGAAAGTLTANTTPSSYVPKRQRTHRGRSTSSSSKQPHHRRAKWLSLSGKQQQVSVSGSMGDSQSSGDEEGGDAEVTGQQIRLTPSASAGSLVDAVGLISPFPAMDRGNNGSHYITAGQYPGTAGRAAGQGVRSRGGVQRQGPRTRIPPSAMQSPTMDGWGNNTQLHVGVLHTGRPALMLGNNHSDPISPYESMVKSEDMGFQGREYDALGRPPPGRFPGGTATQQASGKAQSGSSRGQKSPSLLSPPAPTKYPTIGISRKSPGNQRLEMQFKRGYDLNSVPDGTTQSMQARQAAGQLEHAKYNPHGVGKQSNSTDKVHKAERGFSPGGKMPAPSPRDPTTSRQEPRKRSARSAQYTARHALEVNGVGEKAGREGERGRVRQRESRRSQQPSPMHTAEMSLDLDMEEASEGAGPPARPEVNGQKALDQAADALLQVTAIVEDCDFLVTGCEEALQRLLDCLAQEPRPVARRARPVHGLDLSPGPLMVNKGVKEESQTPRHSMDNGSGTPQAAGNAHDSPFASVPRSCVRLTMLPTSGAPGGPDSVGVLVKRDGVDRQHGERAQEVGEVMEPDRGDQVMASAEVQNHSEATEREGGAREIRAREPGLEDVRTEDALTHFVRVEDAMLASKGSDEPVGDVEENLLRVSTGAGHVLHISNGGEGVLSVSHGGDHVLRVSDKADEDTFDKSDMQAALCDTSGNAEQQDTEVDNLVLRKEREGEGSPAAGISKPFVPGSGVSGSSLADRKLGRSQQEDEHTAVGGGMNMERDEPGAAHDQRVDIDAATAGRVFAQNSEPDLGAGLAAGGENDATVMFGGISTSWTGMVEAGANGEADDVDMDAGMGLGVNGVGAAVDAQQDAELGHDMGMARAAGDVQKDQEQVEGMNVVAGDAAVDTGMVDGGHDFREGDEAVEVKGSSVTGVNGVADDVQMTLNGGDRMEWALEHGQEGDDNINGGNAAESGPPATASLPAVDPQLPAAAQPHNAPECLQTPPPALPEFQQDRLVPASQLPSASQAHATHGSDSPNATPPPGLGPPPPSSQVPSASAPHTSHEPSAPSHLQAQPLPQLQPPAAALQLPPASPATSEEEPDLPPFIPNRPSFGWPHPPAPALSKSQPPSPSAYLSVQDSTMVGMATSAPMAGSLASTESRSQPPSAAAAVSTQDSTSTPLLPSGHALPTPLPTESAPQLLPGLSEGPATGAASAPHQSALAHITDAPLPMELAVQQLSAAAGQVVPPISSAVHLPTVTHTHMPPPTGLTEQPPLLSTQHAMHDLTSAPPSRTPPQLDMSVQAASKLQLPSASVLAVMHDPCALPAGPALALETTLNGPTSNGGNEVSKA